MSATTDWPVGGSGVINLSLDKAIEAVFHHPEKGQACRMGYRIRPGPYSNQTVSN